MTLNDELDYFGQTVNIAAQVQPMADAQEIGVTEGVWGYPGVRALLADCQTQSITAEFRWSQRNMP